MKKDTIKIKTPISYYGGKQQMVDIILEMVPPHKIYCEPFFGGGAVFFKKHPSYLEVINDINENLMNFYEQCQTNFVNLSALIDKTLCSESLFRWAMKVYNHEIAADNLKRALATWVVFNLGFMNSAQGSWRWDNGTDCSHIGRVFLHCRKNFCPWIKTRLESVQISCRDALKVIKQRDTAQTFFYLDPPYPNTDQGHYAGYTAEDLERLLDTLTDIHGQFLLSCYKMPILEQYASKKNWQLKEIIMTKRCVSRYRKENKIECLLYNYNYNPAVFQTTIF